jgi:hypothetical protein
MHQETHGLAGHMRDLGLSMLGHAVQHTIFADPVNRYYGAIGVLHAAQAAEIVLKACIAEQHPLLIFSKLPKPSDDGQLLMLEPLITRGKTLQYSELPDVLWAATGYRLPAMATYRDFGDLRNTIQHLAVPSQDLGRKTLRFLVEVVDQVIQEFWATSLFLHLLEDEEDRYLLEQLDAAGITYSGWVPLSEEERMRTDHPLWLFSPWQNKGTGDKIWVDDHLGGKLQIVRDDEFQKAIHEKRAPMSISTTWRDFIPTVRPQR